MTSPITSALATNTKVVAIPAFNDNYIWCIHNNKDAVVVDPGDATPVLNYLKENELNLVGVLITHHHHDHTGGILKLASANTSLVVYGPNGGHIKGITHPLVDGDTATFSSMNIEFSVMEVPGHTLDHIAYYGHDALFCGDTLFSAGCGRLFEGTPEQMLCSLNKLAVLPDHTMVYCTHEYTAANVAFALAVEPDNKTLIEYKDWVSETRSNDVPTLPTTLSQQKSINPFLRAHKPTVKASVEAHTNQKLESEVAVFTEVRRWKDTF